MKRCTSIVLALFVLGTRAQAGSVLVVAPTGAPFVDIQTAIAASADGDVILVKSGTYPGFSIGDQSLTIAEDAGATVQVLQPVTIGPAGASRTIVLSGLQIHPSYQQLASGPSLIASSVNGFLRIEGCEIRGQDGNFSTTAPDGLPSSRFVACANLVIAGCSLQGGVGPEGNVLGSPHPGHGGVGLELVSSTVAVYESGVLGGQGEYSIFQFDGGHGGLGLDSVGSSVIASQSSFIGGNGGVPLCSGYGGDGGDSVHQSGTSSVTGLQCLFRGGSGGYSSCGVMGASGADGGATSTMTLLGGGRPTTATSVVREQGTITVTVHGQLGDRVGLYLSFLPAQQFIAPWDSVLAISTAPGSGSRLVRIGTLGPTTVYGFTGELTRTFVQPDLGPGLQSQTRWLQTRILTTSGETVLGKPVALTALDAAF